jgi:DNA-binding beta-propeller fold protein YncE
MIYVINFADTSVSVIDGNTCDGVSHADCGQTPPKIAVGNYPGAIATDSAVGTAYVANLNNTVSVVPLTHLMR